MRVPEFKSFADVQKYLIDLAKDREDIDNQFLFRRTANHSLLLRSLDDNSVWEVTIRKTGQLGTTKVSG